MTGCCHDAGRRAPRRGPEPSRPGHIPTFVCSLVADNPFWAARVEQLGIGVHERFASLNQDGLEAGLRRALHAEVVTRSRAIGDRMRADTGAAGRAADLIESKLPD